jgi:hypothetical protein
MTQPRINETQPKNGISAYSMFQIALTGLSQAANPTVGSIMLCCVSPTIIPPCCSCSGPMSYCTSNDMPNMDRKAWFQARTMRLPKRSEKGAITNAPPKRGAISARASAYRAICEAVSMIVT